MFKIVTITSVFIALLAGVISEYDYILSQHAEQARLVMKLQTATENTMILRKDLRTCQELVLMSADADLRDIIKAAAKIDYIDKLIKEK